MSTPPADVKPGAGVDRTLIREQLARTPAERVQVIIEAARAILQIRDGIHQTKSCRDV